ncbi:recombination protein O N-terminal domain-containing protein [Patescibacteria group bacterium]|nr:recombination protein O N-terminal domain-containing protein [Patescibacteria group bacterium]MBU2633028.1 recombination protein O N-terminal domain-containing protein [Patescibacteria group bacterium]
MSYHIYSAEAVILKRWDVGEADTLFSFFTKDFGRIDAKAQGVRYLKSKLRYHLSGFSFVRVSFVETSGDCWRLVDAEEYENLDDIKTNGGKKRSILKVFSLLERLIQGQESDTELWEEVRGFLIFLENNKLDAKDLEDFTISTALNIMAHLGYIDKKKCSNPIMAIQQALEQSQL